MSPVLASTFCFSLLSRLVPHMSDGTYQGVGYLHYVHAWSVSKPDAQMQIWDVGVGGWEADSDAMSRHKFELMCVFR